MAERPEIPAEFNPKHTLEVTLVNGKESDLQPNWYPAPGGLVGETWDAEGEEFIVVFIPWHAVLFLGQCA